MSEFSLPLLMDWTILPSGVIAKAWAQTRYRRALLARPRSVLSKHSRRWPTDRAFVVVEDARDHRYLPLPAHKEATRSWDEARTLAVLIEETAGDTSLRWQLPAQVIHRAWTDPQYKRWLCAEGSAALAAMGHETDLAFTILENTETTYHLSLPTSPVDTRALDVGALQRRLQDQFGATPSSQCCASGTCDD